MSMVRSMLVAIVMVTAGTEALLAANEGHDHDQGFITREWTWVDETSTTSLTVYGPADQVKAFDPQDSHLTCDGCELTSSIQYEPELEAIRTDVAEKNGSKGSMDRQD